MAESTKRSHLSRSHTNLPAAPTRRRITQERINQMVELRRQGLTHKEIGARVGCSERTSRRCVGRVEPAIKLPGEGQEPDVDQKGQRDRLARIYARKLREGWERWKSVRFVAEANRQIQERLADTDPETIRLLLEDHRMQEHYFWETNGPLYCDFRSHERLAGTRFDDGLLNYRWRPPRERKDISMPEDEEFLEPGDCVIGAE
jgi:transposase